MFRIEQICCKFVFLKEGSKYPDNIFLKKSFNIKIYKRQ